MTTEGRTFLRQLFDMTPLAKYFLVALALSAKVTQMLLFLDIYAYRCLRKIVRFYG